MPDIRRAIAEATRRLGERFDAEVLLLHVLGKTRSWLIAHGEDPLSPELADKYAAWVTRREAGEPVAYIVGRRGFWSLDLEVTPATLIPRPETELLVELALQRLAPQTPSRVLDLGTGSGAIALAVAYERPRAYIIAVDASAEALEVARRNAVNLDIANVAFLRGDWFAPVTSERFDLIVSNPPYIESGDPHLVQGDLRFEPPQALSSGEDGLDDIRRIVGEASAHLVSSGWLLCEHGWTQGEAVRTLFHKSGFTDIFTATDIEQRDRVSGGRWPGGESGGILRAPT